MSATSRYLLDPAPGGLSLVQDLVNTRPVAPYGVRDLLGTVADAQRWTARVVRALEGALPRHRRGTSDHVGRPGPRCAGCAATWSAARRAARRGACSPCRAARWSTTPARSASSPPGPACAGWPPRSGARCCWPSATAGGSGSRSAATRTARARSTTASRNNSRVWHDVRTCGNVANLRASRARRRAADGLTRRSTGRIRPSRERQRRGGGVRGLRHDRRPSSPSERCSPSSASST